MELLKKQILDSWNLQLKAANKIFDSVTHEQFHKEVSPGRNTGVYLLGHLVAVHDGMFPLSEIGQKLYPEMEEPFINQPDKSGQSFLSVAELRSRWMEVNEKLNLAFQSFSPEEWHKKHIAVSEEAFEKEPHRNKINILLNRTSHLAYHLGQIALLKS